MSDSLETAVRHLFTKTNAACCYMMHTQRVENPSKLWSSWVGLTRKVKYDLKLKNVVVKGICVCLLVSSRHSQEPGPSWLLPVTGEFLSATDACLCIRVKR